MKLTTTIAIVLSYILLTIGVYKVTAYSTKSDLYPMTGIVTHVSHSTDTVTIQDSNSNLWQFTGAEDWHKGDIASCLMNNNKTPEISDDIIVKAEYNGTIAGWH